MLTTLRRSRHNLPTLTAVALVVAASLSTQSLVSTAERQAYGPARTAAVAAATAVHDRAASVGLDRPAALLRSLSGRSPITRPSPALLGEAGAATQGAGAGTTGPARPTTTTAPTRPTATPTSPPVAAAATATAPSTTVPQPSPRVIGPEDPLRIWAGGDSLGEYVGNHLLAELIDPAHMTIELDYRISTGLARPDYFDWPARLSAVAAGDPPPDVVVYMVGGNDDQNLQTPSGDVVELGSDAWYDDYEARVSSIVDAVDPSATRIYWIGLPPMRDAGRNELSIGMNEAARSAAETRPHVAFVDIGPLLSGEDGGYRPHVTAPDGQLRLARQADGVHITFVGSTWIADRVWELIERDWALDDRPAEQAKADDTAPAYPR